MLSLRRASSCAAFALSVSLAPALRAQNAPTNPNQAEIDAINLRIALLEVRKKLQTLEAETTAGRFPALPDGTGKAGKLEFGDDERDKFHVTARTADAFGAAAARLASELEGLGKLAVLGRVDRTALVAYRGERLRIAQVSKGIDEFIAIEAGAESAGLVGAAALLTQLSQFTQLLRTDKSLSFAQTTVPDELLLDLLSMKMGNRMLYPATALDAVYAGAQPSELIASVRSIAARRRAVAALAASSATPAPRKERAAAALVEIDGLANRLVAIDETSKLPYLLTLVRGELAEGALAQTGGQVLDVSLLSQGGMSLKTSSIWRSDRLYAAGGVVVSYRVTGGSPNRPIVKAGAFASETPFVHIPLDR